MRDSSSAVREKPQRVTDLARDVREGLARPQKELDPKYFYDERGSALFEEITSLDEYYLTRTERSILIREIPRLIERVSPRSIVELGAGSAAKTRIILDAMARTAGGVYVPVDVSEEFLERTAGSLRTEYPSLMITAAVSDFTSELRIPPLPHPTLTLFLGSTIGNFEHSAATRILRRIRRRMHGADRFLLGADLRKDVETIERAYNDAQGVTAEFNRNMLLVLNRELDASFDPMSFDHKAFYDRDRNRIEMHLVSRRAQTVSAPELGLVHLREGESIRTELSYKYDRAEVERLFDESGLELEEWMTDENAYFALALARPAEPAT
ncbi:MAG TPA: L-histidine N(alpha)-methyltransferase [Gemmatimonadaceae bacterium]